MSHLDFDIIIVGGGTAGCVLASRLSELAHLRILLLEAGSDRNGDLKVRTPLTSRRMFRDPMYDWDFRTEPQTNLDNRVIEHTRGRMIGGSSAINSHSLVYPNRDMHDTWARMVADERWSWHSIKDCYAQSCENIQPSKAHIGPKSAESLPYNPVKASFPRQLNGLQKAWEDVFEALDLKSKGDGPSGTCFGGFTTTNAIDDRPGVGERSHAGIAYLQPVLSRRNLVVETEALVERIVFEERPEQDGVKLTAIGIDYRKNGEKLFIKAKSEIVICAGAFGSPQLLELSGIGCRKVLEKVSLRCLMDLPGVGENLQDHLNFGPSVEIQSDIETLDAAALDPSLMATYQDQYTNHRTGPFAEGAAYSFAFWPLQLFNTPQEEAELKRLLGPINDPETSSGSDEREDFIKRMTLSPNEASATVFMTRRQRYTSAGKEVLGNYMTVVAMLSHPFSCGSSHIESADPSAHPKIDCAYLSHPLDAEILARHCLQIERLLEQPTYAPIIKSGGARLPSEFGKPWRSLDEIKSAIAKYGATNYHPCGTCAMGKTDRAVVDGSLKVYGTSNLRVCDASVFPIIPRGNILTTVYAVAEKGAEIISRDYQLRT